MVEGPNDRGLFKFLDGIMARRAKQGTGFLDKVPSEDAGRVGR